MDGAPEGPFQAIRLRLYLELLVVILYCLFFVLFVPFVPFVTLPVFFAVIFSWVNAMLPVTRDRPSIRLMIFFMG